MVNRAAGKGYENESFYSNIKFQFFGIENIHVMRSSLQKLLEGECSQPLKVFTLFEMVVTTPSVTTFGDPPFPHLCDFFFLDLCQSLFPFLFFDTSFPTFYNLSFFTRGTRDFFLTSFFDVHPALSLVHFRHPSMPLCYADKCIVNILNVYVERNNLQLELIQ